MFSFLVLLMGPVVLATGCGWVSFYVPIADMLIPFITFDVCFELRENGTMNSWMLTCDSDSHFEMLLWINANCSGDVNWTSSFSFSDFNLSNINYECDGTGCDYALIRQYIYTNCTNLNFNTSDYMDIAIPINYCEETILPDHEQWIHSRHVSMKCTKNKIYTELYDRNDCNGETEDTVTILEAGCGLNNAYVEILDCPNPTAIDYKLHRISMGIVIILLLVFFIIISLIIFKLFSHLFKTNHNWVIKPSKNNKIYALVCTILYGTYFISSVIIWMVYGSRCIFFADCYFSLSTFQQWQVFQETLIGLHTLGNVFYIFYMTSTLEYHMKDEELMENVIPKKCINFVNILSILYFIIFIIMFSVHVDVLSQNNQIIVNIIDNTPYLTALLLIDISIRLSLFYLFYDGLNNVCHHWYSKRWEEYDKYGENEKTHEIMITITRVAVIVSISIICSFFSSLCYTFYQYYSYFLPDELHYIGYIMCYSGLGIDKVIIAISIYFLYPFSHVVYEKIICSVCHKTMHNAFQKRHQKQVQKGAFDGKRYQSQFSCCYCCKHAKNLEIIEELNNVHGSGDQELELFAN